MNAAATPAGLFQVELPPAPYPGLRPFERHEWPIFFGREPMIRDVITRLLDRKLVVVHGDSGCGKSSLIRAGVLVQLEQQHERGDQRWRTCAILPREAPLHNLAKALAKLDAAETDRSRVRQIRRCLNGGRDAPAALAELLRRGENDHVCILIDQFEELFSLARRHGRDKAQLFVDVLVGLQDDPPPGLYAILTMRSEFLGVCAQFEGLAEAVNETQYLLPQMKRPALLRAIREPATLYDGEVSQELAERLIADAGGGQDQLPLIQHGLIRLWRRKAGPPRSVVEPATPYQHGGLSDSPARFGIDEAPLSFRRDDGPVWRLTLEDYQGAGSLADMLSAHADEVMAEAAPDAKREKIVEHLFRALTDINAEGSAVRRPQTFGELMLVTGSDEQTLRGIIDHFRADGVSFLRPYGNDEIKPNNEIDISHEALIRCWQKIADDKDGWLQREFRDGLIWKTLRMQAQRGETLSATATEARDTWLRTLPSPDWSERYDDAWDDVQRLMTASRNSRDRELQSKRELEEAKRREAEERARRAEEARRAAEEIAAKLQELRAAQERIAEEQRQRAEAERQRAAEAQARAEAALDIAQRIEAHKKAEASRRRLRRSAIAAGIALLIAGGYITDLEMRLSEREQLQALNVSITPAEAREGNRAIFPYRAPEAVLDQAAPLLRAVGPITELSLQNTRVSDAASLVASLPHLQMLELSGKEVSSVAPLAVLTNLHELYLWETPISDVSPLAALYNLQKLALAGTPVSDASPLANLTNLQELDLGGTQVSDLAPLAKLTKLQKLVLAGTQVSDVAPLANLANLKVLALQGTQVSDVSPLANLTNLQGLALGTHVSDVSPLANLANLQQLIATGTQVSDVAPLATLTSLQELDLASTPVSDVSSLAALSNLQKLALAGSTQVSEVSALAKLISLRELSLAITRVTDVAPLANLADLQELDLKHTRIWDVSPLANLANLQKLDLAGTWVSDVSPLAKLTNLQELSLAGTQVSDVSPLASLANLQKLDLAGTGISDVSPLANLANLQELDLGGTQIPREAVDRLTRAFQARGNRRLDISGP